MSGLKFKPVNRDGGYYFTSTIIDGKKVHDYHHYTMANIAATLSSQLGRQVVDATGAEGRYDLKIVTAQDDTHASLIGALGDFGLRLEAAKIEADIFVIDRIEKPSGN